MKKIAGSLVAIAALSTTLTSCLKVKDYACDCTYIARPLGPAEGEPDKSESSTVKGRLMEDARFECSSLDNKYFMQGFDGTCLLK